MVSIQQSLRPAFVVMFTLAIVFAGGVGSVSAQSSSPDWGDQLFVEMESMVGQYNAHAEHIDLGPVSLAGATNVYVVDGDEQATYTIYMDSDHRITDIQQGTDDDATRRMTVDRATIGDIASADNPAAAFRSAVESGAIVITGEDGHILERVTWVIVNALKGFFL